MFLIPSVLFIHRYVLLDIKFAKLNPFSCWVDINRVSTDFRITILNHTIDHSFCFSNPWFFNFHSLRQQFERCYLHLKDEFPWFFSDYIEHRL